MSRYIAITDIHGEIDKLNNLLSKIYVRKDDTIIFMGDYIDRGKHSREVVDRVIKQSDYCRCIYLIGSHEYSMMHAANDEYYKWLFINYGGYATIKSYGSFENIMKIHGDFFNNLNLYCYTEDYFFVHAGINPYYPLDEQDETEFVYIGWNFIDARHRLEQKIIFGHTDFDEPFIDEDKIGINLGCGKSRDACLCALILDNGRERFVYSD